MAEVLKVTSVVHAEGSISESLSAALDELVPAIQLGANPCDFCVANAQSDDPILPPVHNDWNGTPNCHCKLVWVPVHEVITINI